MFVVACPNCQTPLSTPPWCPHCQMATAVSPLHMAAGTPVRTTISIESPSRVLTFSAIFVVLSVLVGLAALVVDMRDSDRAGWITMSVIAFIASLLSMLSLGGASRARQRRSVVNNVLSLPLVHSSTSPQGRTRLRGRVRHLSRESANAIIAQETIGKTWWSDGAQERFATGSVFTLDDGDATPVFVYGNFVRVVDEDDKPTVVRDGDWVDIVGEATPQLTNAANAQGFRHAPMQLHLAAEPHQPILIVRMRDQSGAAATKPTYIRAEATHLHTGFIQPQAELDETMDASSEKHLGSRR